MPFPTLPSQLVILVRIVWMKLPAYSSLVEVASVELAEVDVAVSVKRLIELTREEIAFIMPPTKSSGPVGGVVEAVVLAPGTAKTRELLPRSEKAMALIS